MALFNFYGRGDHRVFDHKPIFYDPEKDKLHRYFGDVDGSNENAEYKPGSYIRGSFRDSRSNGLDKPMKRVQTIITVVTIILVIAVMFFILKLYPYLFVQQ